MSKSTYLASGSYGCVAKPAFKCDLEKKELIEGTVAKLFDEYDSYKTELDIHQKIAKIDKHNEFTIKLFDFCEKDIHFIRENTDKIDDCKLLRESDKVYQLIYEDGGIDLDSFLNTKYSDFDAFEYFKKFINVFKGIKLLIDNKLSHSDIRLDNLLFNGQRIILIDFGLLCNFDNLLEIKSFTKDEQLFYFPDEYPLYLNDTDSIIEPFDLNSSLLLEIIYYKILSINNFKDKYPEYYQLTKELYNYIYEGSINYTKDFNDLKKGYGNSTRKINKLFGSKLDIYQLGIVLYQSVLHIIILYGEEQINKIPKGIFEIIRKMLEPDVKKRIDIRSLIRKYSRLFY